METQLKDLAQEALEECKVKKDWKIKRQKQEKYYEMMRDYKWGWNQQKEREDSAVSTILKQAEELQKANILREYIARCEERLISLLDEGRDLEDITLKLNFLKAKVKTIDPFERYLHPWEVICKHTAIGVKPLSKYGW